MLEKPAITFVFEPACVCEHLTCPSSCDGVVGRLMGAWMCVKESASSSMKESQQMNEYKKKKKRDIEREFGAQSLRNGNSVVRRVCFS